VDPTGKAVATTGMCLMRLAGGRIAEAWNNFDFLTLYCRLGLQLVP
jgi:hypothetical protein